MGTFISYNVSANRVGNKIISHDIIIFDEHCLKRVNNILQKGYELKIPYEISGEKLNSIRSILRNYVGFWTS